MNIRKLEQSEHGKTRILWEEIFFEDTKEFLDYYYSVKIRENRIYVAEDEDGIHAMLHLNPYTIMVNGRECKSNYIVAVATQEKYRHQGLMSRLLQIALKEMYEERIAFTFLMPAAEAIYRPFDFRFIYEQKVGYIKGSKKQLGEHILIEEMQAKDAQEVAKFVQDYLRERYGVFAKRDVSYYQMALEEQKAQNGGICILRDGGKIRGCVFFAREGECELREPVFEKGYEAYLGEMTERIAKDRTCKVLAWENERAKEKRPIIMARIVHMEAFLELFDITEDCEQEFYIEDPILEANNGFYRIEKSKKVHVERCAKPEDGKRIMKVADALRLFEENEKVNRIFLNEIV